MNKIIICGIILLSVLISCSKEDEYGYATLTAELCDAHTSAAGVIDYAINDYDEKLVFSPNANVRWASTPDSIYRTLIYYNKVETAGQPVTPVGVESVMWLAPRTLKESAEWNMKSDPIALESSWLSSNQCYVNMRLSVKSGAAETDKQTHKFGLVCDSIYSTGSAKRYAFRICHDQGDIPAYYSVPVYASVPISDIAPADTIDITVQTWNGTLTRQFVKTK